MDNAKPETVFDSDQQQVGESYAAAIVGFGQKNGNSERLVEQLESFSEALDELPKLAMMLESPGIGLAEKLSLLTKAVEGKIDGHLLNFLKIVLEKGRFNCVPAIAASSRKLLDDSSGMVRATLTTAEAVDESVRQQIAEKLSAKLGKNVQLTEYVDPTIIGGVVVRIGDTVYDGSVRSQLTQVREKATKRAADAIRSSLDKFLAG